MNIRIDTAAEILYMAHHARDYGRSWTTAPDKQRWRNTAEALLRELKS